MYSCTCILFWNIYLCIIFRLKIFCLMTTVLSSPLKNCNKNNSTSQASFADNELHMYVTSRVASPCCCQTGRRRTRRSTARSCCSTSWWPSSTSATSSCRSSTRRRKSESSSSLLSSLSLMFCLYLHVHVHRKFNGASFS